MATKTKLRTYELTCLKCGHGWWSYLERPSACPKCRQKGWDKEFKSGIEVYRPIPTFDHSEAKKLKVIGSRCPYCGGTTGMHSTYARAFCYSCDATFSLCSGEFLGVVEGIGT